MVRVIGRVDLADEVHRALTAAGIDSYVVTAGPTSAAESTGKDGSDADVVVQDFGMCGAIKRKVRQNLILGALMLFFAAGQLAFHVLM